MLRAEDFLFFFVVFGLILLCPYTKVEESFNIQATHDLLIWEVELEKYDHLEFPGVVPRTFLGPLILSSIAYPVHSTMRMAGFSLIYSQILIRAILGLLAVTSFIILRNQVFRSFNKDIAIVFILLCTCQFHIVFYLSRTLPNIFALILVNIGYSFWFKKDYKMTAFIFTCTIVGFRSEILALLGPIMLEALLRREINFFKMIWWGILSGSFTLLVCVAVDSVLWATPGMWAEGVVFYYNAILGKSVNWGVSPFHWYFTNAIPRLMGGTLFFIPFAMKHTKANRILRPILLFIFLYSFLPHKELRFIIYAFPILNLVAASGLVTVYRSTWKYKSLLLAFFALCIFSSVLIGGVRVCASVHNYPGGTAFELLHRKYSDLEDKEIFVHVDALSAQTGISRYGERYNKWHYQKEGYLQLDSFDFLISEHNNVEGFDVVDTISGFSHFIVWPPHMAFNNHIYILKNMNTNNRAGSEELPAGKKLK